MGDQVPNRVLARDLSPVCMAKIIFHNAHGAIMAAPDRKSLTALIGRGRAKEHDDITPERPVLVYAPFTDDPDFSLKQTGQEFLYNTAFAPESRALIRDAMLSSPEIACFLVEHGSLYPDDMPKAVWSDPYFCRVAVTCIPADIIHVPKDIITPDIFITALNDECADEEIDDGNMPVEVLARKDFARAVFAQSYNPQILHALKRAFTRNSGPFIESINSSNWLQFIPPIVWEDNRDVQRVLREGRENLVKRLNAGGLAGPHMP